MSPPPATAPPIGVLGGMFDPVHNGHLELAIAARRLLDLERTLFVPAANPPHKAADWLSPVHHRLAMLRLAIAGDDGLEIDGVELERSGVGYTIDTLRILRDRRPCRPVFLLGADSLAQIEQWRSWEALITEFDLAVMDRPSYPGARRAALEAGVASRLVEVTGDEAAAELDAGRGGRIFLLPVRPVPVASSEERRRVRETEELSDLVPPAVARYIQRTGLYSREEKH